MGRKRNLAAGVHDAARSKEGTSPRAEPSAQSRHNPDDCLRRSPDSLGIRFPYMLLKAPACRRVPKFTSKISCIGVYPIDTTGFFGKKTELGRDDSLCHNHPAFQNAALRHILWPTVPIVGGMPKEIVEGMAKLVRSVNSSIETMLEMEVTQPANRGSHHRTGHHVESNHGR